jgi:broad specificity phosphatase PhoE
MGGPRVVDAVTAEIWLVRHGETDWTAARRFCGWSDPPLNERGRSQARALRSSLTGVAFDRVVSSSSIRAVETARIAYGDPATDDRLRELDFGDIEGTTWDECAPDVRATMLDYETFGAPRGETVSALMTRVSAALRDLGDGRHLVVTHGGVIRGLLGRAGVTDYPAPCSVHPVTVAWRGDDLEVATPAGAPGFTPGAQRP